MVGFNHYDAIASVGNADLDDATKVRINKAMTLYDRAILTARNGSPDVELLCDRALLSFYLLTQVLDYSQVKCCDELANKLDRDKLDEVLSVLGAYLANTSIAPERKASDVKHYLSGLIDILSE